MEGLIFGILRYVRKIPDDLGFNVCKSSSQEQIRVLHLRDWARAQSNAHRSFIDPEHVDSEKNGASFKCRECSLTIAEITRTRNLERVEILPFSPQPDRRCF